MLKRLVGSGDRIMLAVLPFLIIGVIANVAFPSVFAVGGPWEALRILSIAMLVPGVVIWLWSGVLILTNVPRGTLITSGPYAVVKHPIYTAVALLVLPWAGFLLNTWLGAAIGLVLYAADRVFATEEEDDLARRFGARWEAYRQRVLLPWI
jgi:protein-S-isoprenylcysteine O-methyltransferase Ste14